MQCAGEGGFMIASAQLPETRAIRDRWHQIDASEVSYIAEFQGGEVCLVRQL